MAVARRNLHQLLKGLQIYSALHGTYTEVLHDLTAVSRESAANGETAKTTITAPPSIAEFRERRRRKLESTDDSNQGAKKPTASTTGVNDPQFHSKPEVPTRNFFAPLRSIEMEADHGDDADDTTERQQHQALASQACRPPPLY
jgi:hypothetical protein